MEVTPELVDSIGKAAGVVIAAVGGIIATVITGVTAYFTWKTRYELDKLYASTLRANEDGTPGPMRKHPEAIVKLFTREPRTANTVESEDDAKPST